MDIKEHKTVVLNNKLYHAEPVSLYITDDTTLVHDNAFYYGTLTILNPDVSGTNTDNTMAVEKGTWQPELSYTDTTATYNQQLGTYTKVDNLVYYNIHLTEINLTQGVGGLKISLPFPPADNGSLFTLDKFTCGSGTGASATPDIKDIRVTTFATYANLYLYYHTTGGQVNNLTFKSPANAIVLSGVYQIQQTQP